MDFFVSIKEMNTSSLYVYLVLLTMIWILSDNCFSEYCQYISGCSKSSEVNRVLSINSKQFLSEQLESE